MCYDDLDAADDWRLEGPYRIRTFNVLLNYFSLAQAGDERPVASGRSTI
jgi:hypothetical protein